MTFGEKLKYLRKQKNLTQTDFADKLYVTRQAVQKWESDVAYPDVSKLPEIAKLLNVTVDSLLDEMLDETDLVKLLTKSEEKKEHPQKAVKQNSVLDTLLLIPIGLGVAILIGMAYMLGAMLIAMLFSISVGGFAYGLFSVVNIFFNMQNGAGAILLCVSFAFIGIGLSYPCFMLGKFWLNKYIIIVKKLNSLVKRLVNNGGKNEN